jgi:hypothetical protein
MGRAEIDMWKFVAFTVLSFIVVVVYYLRYSLRRAPSREAASTLRGPSSRG